MKRKQSTDSTLQNNPKLRWRGKPLWNPSLWSWVQSNGSTISSDGIEQGKLVNARMFTDQKRAAAIELSIMFEGVTRSTLLRLDDSTGILSLSEQLNELRGFTFKQIAGMTFSQL